MLERLDPDRILYMAVSDSVREDVFDDPLGQLLLAKRRINLLIYHPDKEIISQWTPEPSIVK